MSQTADSPPPDRTALPVQLNSRVRRSLGNWGVRSLADLTTWSRFELGLLDGVGPKTIVVIADAMETAGLRFRDE